ncbi:MAG: sialate O-acetylesterase [Alistipes sp.]|nr:sialate O-acetylesterase [Alistipes sp.]
MKRLLAAVWALVALTNVSAAVKLPGVLSDDMVLQRNAEVNLWGEAAPGRRVRIRTSWNNARYDVRADEAGHWSVRVATGDAGGPYSITFDDGDRVTLENILLGEVWICGGQSNMEMPVCGFMYQPVEGGVDAIVDAGSYPEIRLFTVPRVSSAEPLSDCDASWEVSAPESVSRFSAVGYFFGRTLHKVLGVPVGLITSNWGGSTIETWMTEESIDAIEGIDLAAAKSGVYDNSIVQRLYNGMILPVCNFTAKGFIWYQGESNRRNWYDYKALQVALVDLWRKTWGDETMPFYMTQLAPYRYEGDDLRSLPLVVEAQYKAAAEIPHSGIAATGDLGNPTCIHPPRKLEVGRRLAYLALTNDYGVRGMPRPAPTFASMERDGSKLVLSFDNLSARHSWNDPDSFVGFTADGYVRPQGLEVACEDRVFNRAKASFKWWENKIEVSCDEVPEPVAVRYAFRNYCPEADVRTTMGQPLVPFRTDDWPLDDIGEIR